ncbi:MAG: hypothetical protein JXA54_02330 [Candidatus Heimdallarchaeota archaeon]|nr:hypothetical protein [Candidatus Heimdallarchaeota archaeon]
MSTNRIRLNIAGIISCAIVFLCSITTIIISFILTYKYQWETYEEAIAGFTDYLFIHTVDTTFNLIMGIFIIPASIFIFLYLRNNIFDKKFKYILLIPLISSLIGSGFVIGIYSIKYYILYDIVPAYNIASDPTAIFNQFLNLIQITNILSLVAFILIYTLGAGLFGFISFRTAVIKGNVSWLAMASGILALGKIAFFLENTAGAVFSLVAQMGSILYFFWIASFIIVFKENIKEVKDQMHMEDPNVHLLKEEV